MRKAQVEIEAVRVALVELRRLFQRRELPSIWNQATHRRTRSPDYADLRLLDAIRVAERDRPAAVGEVARLLGLDPSRASRLVASAVRRGLLRRRAAQRDGRRSELEITARGAAVQAKGSALTRARIAVALGAWSASERARFAGLFTRFAEAMR